jgi:hypothetical protein
MHRGGNLNLAGKKQMPAQDDDEVYDEEEVENEEGEEEEEYEEGDDPAADEESGHGENVGDDSDRVPMSTQHPPPQPTESAAKRTMMAVPIDMSLYRTNWTVIVRPPHLQLFKKGVAPSGQDILENVGSARYIVACKKTDANGKTTSVINFWALRHSIITRYGLQRRLFLASEVRDPANRITAGKYKNAPDEVSDPCHAILFDCRYIAINRKRRHMIFHVFASDVI